MFSPVGISQGSLRAANTEIYQIRWEASWQTELQSLFCYCLSIFIFFVWQFKKTSSKLLWLVSLEDSFFWKVVLTLTRKLWLNLASWNSYPLIEADLCVWWLRLVLTNQRPGLVTSDQSEAEAERGWEHGPSSLFSPRAPASMSSNSQTPRNTNTGDTGSETKHSPLGTILYASTQHAKVILESYLMESLQSILSWNPCKVFFLLFLQRKMILDRY